MTVVESTTHPVLGFNPFNKPSLKVNGASKPAMPGSPVYQDISRSPDRTILVEYMFYDLWGSMRAKDKDLANEILEPTFIFMRAQIEKIRTEITEFGQYLHYRERDVGKALLLALMRFAMDQHLTPEELEAMKPVELNCAKHISIVNDIYSWEKELKQSQITEQEGSSLCSGLRCLQTVLGWILMLQMHASGFWAGNGRRSTKSFVLSPIWHQIALRRRSSTSWDWRYQMSGNEIWSRTTPG
ncbi:hypothetical protein DL767_003325 [Monosporascus sp. MG133]|nr:hypothetical protein DL767_003325 [Monosporascus sp. MG133]